MFVRKRKHDSPLDMIITPAFNYVKIKSSDLPASRDSFVDQNSCESLLKISFSTSYSTPCPIQPRKKLKLKDDSTPSHPLRLKKPLLNLSCSTKVSAGSEPLIDKLNNAGDEDSYGDNSGEEEHERNPAQSTPISQSTPANSRALHHLQRIPLAVLMASPSSKLSQPSHSSTRLPMPVQLLHIHRSTLRSSSRMLITIMILQKRQGEVRGRRKISYVCCWING